MSKPEACTLIGIVDDGWAGLADSARQRLAAADLVIGSGRTLALVRPWLLATTTFQDMDGALGQLPDWILGARAAGQRVAVLATGDPLCHGIASWLTDRIGDDACEIMPNVSTLQLACARFKTAWQDIRIASCHGVDSGDWFFGATPAHALYPLMRTLARHQRVMLFTAPANNPARLARALIVAGYGDEARLSIACRLLLPDEQVFAGLAAGDAAGMIFPEPNVVLVERPADPERPICGIDDLEYRQRAPEKGLITKQEARVLSLAKLRIRPQATVWDIGAGSGAVGLEAARLAPCGHVWAIEKNPADAANARANAAHFRIGNYTLHEGRAPAQIDTWPDPDAVFIGGSGGELAELIRVIVDRLKPAGRLVMNFVTLENLATATATLSELNAHWDVVLLQASRSQPIIDMHRLAAENPVWVVTASRDASCP